MSRYIVKPGGKVRLKDQDPEDKSDWKGEREEAELELIKLRQKLSGLQEILYAQHKERILIVLQAMDTGGKDGTIRHVFEGVNPQGVRIANFKAPSAVELDHDYLWRIHPLVPGKGEIVIFNRSHYEDVIVVRVHELVPEKKWRKRYDQIAAFESMLAEEGVTILKFYLHIDKDEQKERLEARLAEPSKHWKFNPRDLDERKLWPDYMEAYEEALSKTSTREAPWYIIPANRKWYRNLVITRILVDTLESLDMKYPAPPADLDKIVVD
ncbi:MAG: polyphosphate kinase 2 family protein [Candidatus Hydrogenedentota bacterium]